MKTDITINATSATDNKKVTNKISYVNPNLTNGQAIELAQAFNQLTTNSYVKTTRTDTIDCDEVKPARVISSIASLSGATIEEVDGVYKITITASAVSGTPKAVNIVINSVQLYPLPIYTPKVINLQIQGAFAFYSFRMEKQNISRIVTYFTQDNQPVAGETIKGTIVIPEDQNYAELTVPFEIYLV